MYCTEQRQSVCLSADVSGNCVGGESGNLTVAVRVAEGEKREPVAGNIGRPP
jgi:hypothetical protein